MSTQSGAILKVTGISATICGVAFALSAITPVVYAQSASSVAEPATEGVFYLVEKDGTQYSLENIDGKKIGADSSTPKFSVQGEHSKVRFPEDTKFRFVARLPLGARFVFREYSIINGQRIIIGQRLDQTINVNNVPIKLEALTEGKDVNLHSERIGNGSELFTPLAPLPEGEYCFAIRDGLNGVINSFRNRVFCFGVDAAGSGIHAQESSVTSTTQAKPAAAPQSKIDDSTDLDGLNLNMTPAQVRERIHAKRPAAKDTKIIAALNTMGRDFTLTVGDHFGTDVQRFEFGRNASGITGEYFKILYGPNSNKLYEIMRYKGFRKSEYITRESVISALIKKYGNPIVAPNTLFKLNTFLWIARTDYKITGYGDDFQYNQHPASGAHGCGVSSIPESGDDSFGHHAFLYEDGGFSRDGIDTVPREISDAFLKASQEAEKYAGCGLILEVTLNLDQQSIPDQVTHAPKSPLDMVAGITEKIVDFDRASEELKDLPNALIERSNKEDNQKRKQDMAKPPEL